jgi:hypothetical protein
MSEEEELKALTYLILQYQDSGETSPTRLARLIQEFYKFKKEMSEFIPHDFTALQKLAEK